MENMAPVQAPPLVDSVSSTPITPASPLIAPLPEQATAEPILAGSAPAESVEIPPVVYIPILTEVADSSMAQIVYYTLADGQVALPIYTSLAQFRDLCGKTSPYVFVKTEHLDQIRENYPFDLIVVDTESPSHHRAGVRNEG